MTHPREQTKSQDQAPAAAPSPSGDPLARPAPAPDSVRRLRRTIVGLVAFVSLLWAGVLAFWVEETQGNVLKDARSRLVNTTLKAALPIDRLLHALWLRLEEASSTDINAFIQLAEAHRSANAGLAHFEWQERIVDENGDNLVDLYGGSMVPKAILTDLIARTLESWQPVLSDPYRVADAWYATALGPAPVAGDVSGGYVAITFPLAPLISWWRTPALLDGANVAVMTLDGHLWWAPEQAGQTAAMRESVSAAIGAAASGNGFAQVTGLDEKAGDHLVSWHDLEAFGVHLVAQMPPERLSAVWRQHHLSSLVLFIVVGLAIPLAICAGGSRVLKEAGDREAAMRAVAAGESRFRDIADAASDWFWEMGPDLRFTYLSDRVHQVSGVKPETFIGKRRSDFLDPGMSSERFAKHWRDLEARRPFRDFVYPQDVGDKRKRWIKISGKPIFDADGSFMGYRGTGTDITATREAEEQLAAAQLRLFRAIENSPNAFALFDERERLVRTNRRFQELLFAGQPDAVQVDTTYEELMRAFAATGHSLEAARDPEIWLQNRLARRGSGESFDEPLCDGRWLRVQEYRTPEGDLICVYNDITRFKEREVELIRLAEENRRLAAAVGATQAGVVISNPRLPDNPIVFVNPAFCQITGYEAPEAIGRNCRFLQGPNTDQAALEEFRRGLTEDRPVAVELLNYRKDGTPFWNRVNLSPVLDEDGTASYFVAVQSDVSRQKDAERELLLAKEAAEVANRSKSEFLAVMSHELRTPLNAIIGFSDILKAEMFGQLGDVRYIEYAGDIHESGSHLLALINDILDLSKGEAGKLELHEEVFALDALIERCFTMVRPRAEDLHLKLASEIPAELPQILGDQRKIKQVILNLLSNAIKFSNEKGSVTVSVALGHEGLRVSVIDTGIGMAPEDIPRALEAFAQVDSAHSRQHEGTGLGLPLAKRFVELHGGTLSIESRAGAGTSVGFVIPIRRLQRNAA